MTDRGREISAGEVGRVDPGRRKIGFSVRARVLFCCFIIAVSFGIIEIVGRALGVGNIPLYVESDVLGYMPAASQSGKFLNMHSWAFNDRGMGTSQDFRISDDGILLVGDSVVFGGNSVDQKSKLGPMLQRQTGCPVWPLSAGGWSLNNQLSAIFSSSDYMRLKTIVIVSNSGDFGELSTWQSDYTQPRSRPFSVVVYAATRVLGLYQERTSSKSTPAAERQWRRGVEKLLANFTGKLIWVLYPRRAELPNMSPDFAALRDKIKGRADIIYFGDNIEWNGSFYRDAIHPKELGIRAMSSFIAARLPKCAA